MILIGKDSVRLYSVKPEIFGILPILDAVFGQFDLDCIITSAADGEHMPRSLHYVGYALDLRRRHVPAHKVEAIDKALKDALTAEYDVVLESTHWHIEFQPEKGVNL